MAYEYKCVGAPERAKRKRGAKTRTDRVAVAMEEALAEHAVDGWEYVRTDLIPIEERSGMFSRAHEVHRAVMVFRRPLAQRQHQEPVFEDRPARAEDHIRLAADRDVPASDGAIKTPGASRKAPTGLG